MHLPIELIQEIVIALSAPDHSLQYGHNPDVRHALCQLSLTSRMLRDITTPYLYCSIVISSPHELKAFLRTSSTMSSFPRSLWLRYFDNMLPFIASLLHLLSPHLRRLALDIPGDQLDHSILVRKALQCCSRLEDFTRSGYSPMQLIPPPAIWPDWRGLRRLVLDGPLIDDIFICAIAELRHLTHLAPIEPRWRYSDDGTEVAAFLDLLNAGQSLERVFLIYCKASEFYLNSLKRLRKGVKTLLRDGLDVSYVVMREKAPIPMNRIRRHIGEGTIWDLESTSLLGSHVDLSAPTIIPSQPRLVHIMHE